MAFFYTITMKIILLFLITISSLAQDLKIKWLGTTNIIISDEQTTIVFDPFVSRPSLFQVASFQNLQPSKEVFNKWYKKEDLVNTKAIFISHTHYDHILDLPILQKKTGSKVYGSTSLLNAAKGLKIKKELVFDLSKSREIKIGKFKIIPFKGVHPSHFMGLTLASGDISRNFKSEASFLSYKMGQNYNFYIIHPKGSILFHPSAIVSSAHNYDVEVDLLIQGIAKRESTKSLIDKIFTPSKAKLIIPVHQDDFFEPLSEGMTYLTGIDMKEYNFFIKEKKIRSIELRYAKEYSLPSLMLE